MNMIGAVTHINSSKTTTSRNQSAIKTADFIPFVKAVGRGATLRRDLSVDESADAMRLILQGRATDAQIGAFLIGQRVKGEAIDELLGFTQVVREEFVSQIRPRVVDLLDLAVPYDGKVKTAQLAPAIALVLVAAGAPVVLHGDYDVPTKSGVGPGAVLTALGIATDLELSKASQMIERFGFGYLAAQTFAPRWHDLLPLRRQFGLRTVLNSVEKFLNPANAPYQVSGFFHANYIDRIRSSQTGLKASWIVQGEEGSIETAAGRRTPVYGVKPESDWVVDPGQFGLGARERVTVPGEVSAHAAINASVLEGQSGPASDQVALTSATIMKLLGIETTLMSGLDRARSILFSGAALSCLERARGY